jgi:hypothetical protein
MIDTSGTQIPYCPDCGNVLFGSDLVESNKKCTHCQRFCRYVWLSHTRVDDLQDALTLGYILWKLGKITAKRSDKWFQDQMGDFWRNPETEQTYRIYENVYNEWYQRMLTTGVPPISMSFDNKGAKEYIQPFDASEWGSCGFGGGGQVEPPTTEPGLSWSQICQQVIRRKA